MLPPFMTPEMDVMLMILGEKPGVFFRPWSSSGRKAAPTKYSAVTFVANVSDQLSGPTFHRCSEMALASLRSGFELAYLVASSRAMPALLTRSWMPLGSLSETCETSFWMSSLLVTSAGNLLCAGIPCQPSTFQTSAALEPVQSTQTPIPVHPTDTPALFRPTRSPRTRSQSTHPMILPGPVLYLSTTAFSASSRRPVMYTRAPLATRPCVIIKPMPVPPPVTTAAKPETSNRLEILRSSFLAANPDMTVRFTGGRQLTGGEAGEGRRGLRRPSFERALQRLFLRSGSQWSCLAQE